MRLSTIVSTMTHEQLFTLPASESSTETLPAAQTLPPQQSVTSDMELDALLWLRQVIATGQEGMIELAMEAAKKIETPLDILEKRYAQFLDQANPGNFFATFPAFGLADLEGWAKKSIETRKLQLDGEARFGDRLFEDTLAETYCIKALRGLKREGVLSSYKSEVVADRFKKHKSLLPSSLTACLAELKYWNDLYHLRNVKDSYASDGPPQAQAREWFVFGLMAEIPPQSLEESLSVRKHMIERGLEDMAESDAIIENLIRGGWNSCKAMETPA